MNFLSSLRSLMRAIPWVWLVAGLAGWYATHLVFTHWPAIKESISRLF
ncbi:MAG: hypothetical protein U1F61_19695 [Opitutaceae bacterium]